LCAPATPGYRSGADKLRPYRIPSELSIIPRDQEIRVYKSGSPVSARVYKSGAAVARFHLTALYGIVLTGSADVSPQAIVR